MAVSLFSLLLIASTLYELRQNRIDANAAAFKKTNLDYDVMKVDKVHPNSNGNGQNMELQQISVENNNDNTRMNTNMQNGVICQPKILAKNGEKMGYKQEVKMAEKTESKCF